jgi:nucleoporin NUP159
MWLERDLFLGVYSTIDESKPTFTYYIITRQTPARFSFRELPEPLPIYRDEEAPYLSVQRLRDFPPALQDLLIVSSPATPDIGLFSRSKSSLSSYTTADSVINVFTTTEVEDEDRKAAIPLNRTMDFGVPIGTALDLSGKEPVYKPIPTEEIDRSPGPVPGYWILTDDGTICSWWIIYSDSIKNGTVYPGLDSLHTSGTEAGG